MATHDPVKHIKFLRQTLSQDKKPLGFFISAGCPLAVNMPDDKWPLIPDVAKLTQFVTTELKSKTEELFSENKNEQEGIGQSIGIMAIVAGTIELGVSVPLFISSNKSKKKRDKLI